MVLPTVQAGRVLVAVLVAVVFMLLATVLITAVVVVEMACVSALVLRVGAGVVVV